MDLPSQRVRRVRGFRLRGVGPNQNGNPIGGETMLNGSLEYRQPLHSVTQPGTYQEREVVRAAIFVDYGLLDPKPFSLDFEDAENRYHLEPEDRATAERLYQRRWALTLFAAQMVLNGIWTPVFFGAHRITLAFVILVALGLTLVATILVFRHVDRVADVERPVDQDHHPCGDIELGIETVENASRARFRIGDLTGLRVDQPHVPIVPLHLDALADPAGRRAVVRRLDLDAAVEVDGTFAVTASRRCIGSPRCKR